MKSIQPLFTRSLLVAVLVAAGFGTASAHYTHDKKGWYDENHHRHAFVTHNGHRGFWDKNDHGIWAFISI